MTTAEEIQNEDGTWIFIAPIKGLILTKAVNFEYKVDHVTFISSSHLPYRRKRFGFPYTISDLRKKHHKCFNEFFSKERTFATLRLQGKGKDLREKFLRLVREELAILSLSQLGYGRRKHNAYPMIYKEHTSGITNYLLFNSDKLSITQQNQIIGKINRLVLDKRWKNFQSKVFFLNLVKIISKKINVRRLWQKDIKNAAILAGQSQCSADIPQSFLWNMIAIELLLTRQGDKYLNALPERAEAFLGWAVDWKKAKYEERIREIYEKRCKFVHDGNREAITIKDVLFSDDLLLNVINNIVKYPKLFFSKEKLIKFSEKVKAEHLLGIKSKVRPKSLQFFNIHYQNDDFKKI